MNAFLHYPFEIREGGDRAVPRFSAAAVRPPLAGGGHKLMMTLVGPESVSLLAIHEAVEWMTGALPADAELEWEFLPSPRARESELAVYLQPRL